MFGAVQLLPTIWFVLLTTPEGSASLSLIADPVGSSDGASANLVHLDVKLHPVLFQYHHHNCVRLHIENYSECVYQCLIVCRWWIGLCCLLLLYLFLISYSWYIGWRLLLMMYQLMVYDV